VRAGDLPLKYRLLIRTYRWRRQEAVPGATRRRPLGASRVALVTTAGLVPAGTEPFDLEMRGGDPSFRIVAHDVPAESLTVHHRSDAFDRGDLAQDLNVVFPRDVLARLQAGGAIGEVASRHLSFMGSITAPGRLIRDHAPRAADILVGDGVDVALLVPV
jgi:D-proline reductase (dithiol) PrdB